MAHRFHKSFWPLWLPALCCLLLASCSAQRDYRMFRTVPSDLSQRVAEQKAEAYTLQPGDQLELRILTNSGEGLLIAGGVEGREEAEVPSLSFSVTSEGSVQLPIIGAKQLAGYTETQLDSLLSLAYADYFHDPFVQTSISSHRVLVLGALGHYAVPLEYSHMTVLDALAAAQQGTDNFDAAEVLLLRGPTSDPQVFPIDLSTVQGLRNSQMDLLPGDVIYIPEDRLNTFEGFQQVTPFISLGVSVATIIILISRN